MAEVLAPHRPRPQGLLRRQSYDPLTVKSLALSLSLGTLPAPHFAHIPSGQRSVPAFDTRRRFGGSNYRTTSTAGADGAPRTPGGSLVVGFEFFGGGKAVKEPKERWGTGSVADDDGEGWGETTPTGLHDPVEPAWPTVFEAAVTTGLQPQELQSQSQLDGHRSAAVLHNAFHVSRSFPSTPLVLETGGQGCLEVENLLTLFSVSPVDAGYWFPKKNGLFAARVMERARVHSGNDQSSSDYDELDSDPSLFDSTRHHISNLSMASQNTAALGSQAGPNGDSTTPTLEKQNTFLAPFSNGRTSQPPAQNGSHSSPSPSFTPHNPPPPPPNGYLANYSPFFHPPPLSAEELAAGMMTTLSLGDHAQAHRTPSTQVQTLPGGVRAVSYSPYLARDNSLPAPARQVPQPQHNPYFQPSSYQPLPQLQDYTLYEGATNYYLPPQGSDGGNVGGAAGVGGLQARRDSGYASHPSSYPDLRTSPELRRSASQQSSGWSSISMQLPTEYGSTGPASPQTSRHSSFSSYSPGAMPHQSLAPYGLVPGGGFQPSSLDLQTPLFLSPIYAQQQQQLLLGRGVRSPEFGGVAQGGLLPQMAYPAYGMTYPAPATQGRYDDVARISRSPLLEDFRTNRNRSWELTDIVNHVVEFSGDQLGSRHIQTKLETASADEKQLVFDEILPNMLQLSTDVFANYVIQKFFEQGSQAQKTALGKVLEGHVLQLSLQMYGCRVVQKALEYVLLDQQIRLIKELDGHVLKCARDAQSNHVIQRALERVPSTELTFITDACLGEVNALATHPYGCRVLQRVFENCPPAQTRALLDELHLHTQTLIQDQYGNYVVQWIIEKGEPADRSRIISQVHGQLLPLAQQKFASNVIEKCILHATEEERHALIEEVLTPAPDGTSLIKSMLVHPYANYVMQKILNTASGSQRELLFAQTGIQLANLKKFSSSYSKHLLSIEKLLVGERARKY